MDNNKDAIGRRHHRGLFHKRNKAVPDEVSRDSRACIPRDEIHVGYIPVPRLDGLMELRDALVALKGPLASDPGLQANLLNRMFNEETHNRVLGELNIPVTSVISSIPFG